MTAQPPRIIGHRGAAGLAPENTLAGFRKAAEIGLSWVEFDVHLSADGVPVLIHDDTLDRTTNGRGPVAKADLAALKRLDAGSWFDPAFRGETIPTLGETVSLLGQLGMSAVVEIKPSPGAEALTAEVAASVLLAHWPTHLTPPILSSFSAASLSRARDTAPALARGFLARELPRDWRTRIDSLGCSSVHLGAKQLDAVAVNSVIEAGLPVFAYTVNDAAQAAELYGWGVSGVFSDRPDKIR